MRINNMVGVGAYTKPALKSTYESFQPRVDNIGAGIEFERTRPYTVTENHGLNTLRNSISLVNGVQIDMGDGFFLRIKEASVVPAHERLKPIPYELTMAAKGLDFLIRIANNQFTIDFKAQTRQFYEGKEAGQMQKATIKALEKAGIDTSRKFYINDTAFKVEKGFIRKIHTRMEELLDERGTDPLIAKYAALNAHNHIADHLIKEADEDGKR